ncbi:MAG: hypothetical protein ACOY99_08055 [Pseudomonadota bacterium]
MRFADMKMSCPAKKSRLVTALRRAGALLLAVSQEKAKHTVILAAEWGKDGTGGAHRF